jgi:hypothetical protein
VFIRKVALTVNVLSTQSLIDAIRASVIGASTIRVNMIGCTNSATSLLDSPLRVEGTSMTCLGGLGLTGCTIQKFHEVKIV